MEGHALPRQKKQFHPSASAEEKLLWKESWEMSQIILFDLDGTLTESGEGITKCVQYALSRFGIQEPDLEKLRCFVGPPLLESFMEYAGLSREDAEKAVEYYRERYNTTGIYENRLYPKIRELLELLKVNDKILGVASSKPEVYVRKILEYFKVDGYFQVIVGSELDGRRTGKAEVIEEALRRLDLNWQRDSVLMVGDREHDVKGARECGLQCIGVTYGYGTREELETAGAVYVAESVEDLGILASPNDEETTEHVESVRASGKKRHVRRHRRRHGVDSGTENGDRGAAGTDEQKEKATLVKDGQPVGAKKEEALTENPPENGGAKDGRAAEKNRETAEGARVAAAHPVFRIWRAVYPVLLHYVISILVVCGMVAFFLLADKMAARPEDPQGTARLVQENNLYQILITSVIGGVVMFLLYRKDQLARKAGFLGRRGPDRIWAPPVMWISVIVLGIAGSQFFNDVIWLTRLREIFPGYDQAAASAMEGQPVWLLMASVGILAPIAEELVFRGLVYRRLQDWMAPWMAILLSSLIFGLYHGNVVQFVYAALTGSLFALMYYRTGTLGAAMAGHAAANLWSLFGSGWMQGILENHPRLVPVKLLAEILLAVIPAYWIFASRRKKSEKQ